MDIRTVDCVDWSGVVADPAHTRWRMVDSWLSVDDGSEHPEVTFDGERSWAFWFRDMPAGPATSSWRCRGSAAAPTSGGATTISRLCPGTGLAWASAGRSTWAASA